MCQFPEKSQYEGKNKPQITKGATGTEHCASSRLWQGIFPIFGQRPVIGCCTEKTGLAGRSCTQCVFQARRRLERSNALCRNVDRSARGWVAARACCADFGLDGGEGANRHVVAGNQLGLQRAEEGFDCCFSLRFSDASFFSGCGDQCGVSGF